MSIQLSHIIEKLNPKKVVGTTDRVIKSVIQFTENNIDDACICWVNDKNLHRIPFFKQGVLICSDKADPNGFNKECTYILVESPRKAFQLLIKSFFVKPEKTNFISDTAKIGSNVTLGKNVYIGHHTIIEDNCVIGNNTIIKHNNVILEDTVIGNNVKIGSNNTIGGVGFGYEKNEEGEYELIPHIGNVIIENEAEIGNNTCIDRGVLGSTFIKNNAKIDNLVHIAHGVVVGENSLVIAHAIIGGSTVIGKNVWVAPNVSIKNGLTIGDDVTIGLSAVVLKNVDDNAIMIGNPAKPLEKK